MDWLRKKYSINDLSKSLQRVKKQKRNNFKIAIIDDEPFLYLEELKKLDFVIHQYNDINTLDMLSSYNIIICDIKGVGKIFNSEYEGAFLISELIKKYPYKVFAAYTGAAFDISINRFLDGAEIIKKDIAIDEWADAIDSLIIKVSDPIVLWKKLRIDLLNRDIEIRTLADLEHKYVDTILNKKSDFSNFLSEKQKSNLSQTTIDLISNVIVKGALAYFSQL